MLHARCLSLLAVAAVACGGDSNPSSPDMAASPTVLVFDTAADLHDMAHFFDAPYPSDARLSSTGGPDLAGFPNPRGLKMVEALLQIAVDRPGFPVAPVGYFRFTKALAPLDAGSVILADKNAPILLLDVDDGTLLPLVASTPAVDDWVPEGLLAVAPRPGIVLLPQKKYAFVVTRALTDADGKTLGVDAVTAALASGATPPGAQGAALATLYAPLWPALAKLGVPATGVAAATVFTTGDVVADMAKLSDLVRAKYSVSVDNLHLVTPASGSMGRFCELTGTVTYPQFQSGKPPFGTPGSGLFQIGTDGLPVKQRDETAPVYLTLPTSAMPKGGWPLVVYFHGSGGSPAELPDRGPVTTTSNGVETPGQGPAYVLAPHGIAGAASALPLNPDRFPGASDYEYLNIDNLAAFRDTFRQGVLEQRLFIEALRTLTIDPAVVAGCSGPSLPEGETAYRFNSEQLGAQGQSMGGMYTNLISAVEPRIKVTVPTGAGGDWGLMILSTAIVPGAATTVAAAFGTDESLTFMHPSLALLETAWEPAEPMVYMPRVARRPLDGMPARPIYEPVGQGDLYFSTAVYDAMALAYGNQEAGNVVWPAMEQALMLDGDGGIASYPVKDNRTSTNAQMYTGVVTQWMGDGIGTVHSIAFQLDPIKHQYGCFFRTFFATGTAVVSPPDATNTPCAE